jgi:hypothetical protein
MIFDPLQLDLAGDPVVLVGHVSRPDHEGMVTITGHHESGRAYCARVAADWPVELDRGQREDFALLIDLERLLLADDL